MAVPPFATRVDVGGVWRIAAPACDACEHFALMSFVYFRRGVTWENAPIAHSAHTACILAVTPAGVVQLWDGTKAIHSVEVRDLVRMTVAETTPCGLQGTVVLLHAAIEPTPRQLQLALSAASSDLVASQDAPACSLKYLAAILQRYRGDGTVVSFTPYAAPPAHTKYLDDVSQRERIEELVAQTQSVADELARIRRMLSGEGHRMHRGLAPLEAASLVGTASGSPCESAMQLVRLGMVIDEICRLELSKRHRQDTQQRYGSAGHLHRTCVVRHAHATPAPRGPKTEPNPSYDDAVLALM